MTQTTSFAGNWEYRICRGVNTRVVSGPISNRAFLGVSATLFAAAVALTIACCAPMSAMPGMPMPGGWSMSMAWMRMPGHTWTGAAASFVAMWVVMMAAMMLPSFTPMLWRYRQSLVRSSEARLGRMTARVTLGYFSVWALVGLAIFPAGVAMAGVEMEHPALSRAVPIAAGFVILAAGALQLTKWKARRLACCRQEPARGCTLPGDGRTAWRQGIHFGVHCGLSCANLTAVLLVLGVMDLRAMAAVTAAITAERLAPAGQHVARAIGFVVAGAGLILLVRAAGKLAIR